MTPGVAIALLGLGAGVVYLTTYPGGWRAAIGLAPAGLDGYDNPTSPGGFTQDQLDYYFGGFTTHLTNAQAAQMGAGIGANFAGFTFGISIGVGAAIGWLAARNSNDTREDREVFANRLGFPGDGLGANLNPTTDLTDKSKGLYSYLIFIERDDLTGFALNQIGRKDFDTNTQWMVDVMAALWRAGFPFPK